jgi:arylsulfatase A-like enzyme
MKFTLGLLTAFVALLGGLPATAQTKKPNVIIILMDDMGYGDTEPYGMTGVPTPNFNRVAAEGTRFTHYNVGQPVCTASRASLLTGAYPNRIGMEGVLLPGATRALNPSEQTLPTLLKKVGYETAMLGKWHLGNKAPYLPLHYGFDSFYGIPYSHDIWPIAHDNTRVTDPKDIRFSWPALPVYEGDKQVDSILTFERQARLTPDLTKRAVAFIKKKHDRPFFLYFAHPLPHVPLVPSAQFQGKSGLGKFGDVLMELDWSLGEVLKALDENKLAQNTILLVCSDNGPWLQFGDNAGSAGGFREGKSTTFEGGTRVSLLVRWPGKVKAANVNSHLMTSMDLLPTLAAATGAPLPAKKIDGLNFLPLWLGQAAEGPREVFYYYYDGNTLRDVRYRHWKLVFPHTSNSYAGLHGKGGMPNGQVKVQVPMALYDLAHDPGEAYDVQQLYPEIVEKLKALAEEARQDLGDGLTNRPGTNVRPAAKVQ